MRVSAESFIRCLPTSVEPVKLILSTPGCLTIASPTMAPLPGSTFSTPGGSPASSASSPMRIAVSGVISAGFRTTQFPAASAGAAFQPTMIIGKFQGMIAPTTPSGSRRVKVKNDGLTGRVSPASLVTHPAK